MCSIVFNNVVFFVISESLLHGFFVFYSTFDFSTNSISIAEGCTFPKSADASPIHVENPLCIGANICQNVDRKSLNRLTVAMETAAKKMETFSETMSQGVSHLDILFQSDSMELRTELLSDTYFDNPDLSFSTDTKMAQVEISDLFEQSDDDPYISDQFCDSTQSSDLVGEDTTKKKKKKRKKKNRTNTI